MNSDAITIRSIQHYMYCPHRWGLIEIDRAWSENAFVTKANIMHERVHNPDKKYTQKGKIVFTSVPVYNDKEEYNLYGVTDCIEATKVKDGVRLPGYDELFQLCIIEYKPKKPKVNDYNEEDLMQVFAQKVCVDYVFQCDCDVIIYYADVKKRVLLPIKENYKEYDRALITLLSEIRFNMMQGIIPPIKRGQNCNGCSMKDMCMPRANKSNSLRCSIDAILKEAE